MMSYIIQVRMQCNAPERGGKVRIGFIGLEATRSLGVALPNTATAQELLNACAARGGADQDHAAMVRALEILADHPVA